MKKSRSQIMAIILASLNSLIIIPALFGIAATILLLLVAVDKASSRYDTFAVLLVFCIWIVAAIGIAQYFGYLWHSFSILSRKKALMLWISTIIYNLLIFILSVVTLIFSFKEIAASFGAVFYTIIHFLVLLVTIGISITALKDELTRNS